MSPENLNIGQAAAAAWEEACNKKPDVFAGRDFYKMLTEPLKKPRKPSKARLARWKREEQAWKRKTRRELAKLKGHIVKVEGDLYQQTLVYADGRRLQVYEHTWLPVKANARR